MKNIKYIAIVALGLIACEPELDNSITDGGVYTSGDVDLSNYVAVGNSLTAGYSDGALFINGQNNSYPNLMANRFALAGGGAFNQPMVNDNLGGLLMGGTQIQETRLVLSGSNQASLAPVRLSGTPTTDITNVLSGNFNNMGVPGAKSFHLLANGYGNVAGVPLGAANPYFVRFASDPNTSVIADAVVQNPSFFSLWIGNNDVLSFATSGGVGVDQTGNIDPSTYGSNDITDPNVFAATYQALLGQLTANGAKGVVMNLPAVTSIPYFTTVPYNPIPMDAATAGAVNSGYATYNGALNAAVGLNMITAAEAAKRTINFTAGQNAVVIEDESLTDLSALGPVPNIRMATANDLIVLPARVVIGTEATPGNPATVYGVGTPLSDHLVLTENEIAMIAAAQNAYNATISALASSNPDVIMVDVKAIMEQLANGGLSYDGGMLTNAYATGGAFSLDGVHPTARGYALIANAVIEKMNMEFGGTIPMVNPGTYPTIYLN